MLMEHFNLGITIYKGYIDDPRNTDNAWIETIAGKTLSSLCHTVTLQLIQLSHSSFSLCHSSSILLLPVNYHDSTGVSFSKFPLQAEGSSLGVQWITIDQNLVGTHSSAKLF